MNDRKETAALPPITIPPPSPEQAAYLELLFLKGGGEVDPNMIIGRRRLTAEEIAADRQRRQDRERLLLPKRVDIIKRHGVEDLYIAEANQRIQDLRHEDGDTEFQISLDEELIKALGG